MTMETSFKRSFAEKEAICEAVYRDLGPCYHIYTAEGFDTVFVTEADFKAGMTILAICAMAFPDIRILTFQLMGNHLHLTVAGARERCLALFDLFKKRLQSYLKRSGSPADLKDWDCSIKEITDLKYLRTVIVYTNRNGFVVNHDDTPFSYRWGANRFFFNPDSVAIHTMSREKLTVRQVRGVMHSADFDWAAGLPLTDGYVSPLAFCDIRSAMALFRDAHHYFHMVSRDVESQKMIARELGESVFYSDNELFNAAVFFIREKYGISSPSILPKESKIETAVWMHHDYNAGNRQIARILRLDLPVLDALFPPGR